MTVYTKTANDVFAPVDAGGAPRSVDNHDAEVLLTEVVRNIDGKAASADLAAEIAARQGGDAAAMDAIASEAATRQQAVAAVDAKADQALLTASSGIRWTSNRVRVRATGNVNLANGLVNATVLNGVTLATGDHVFLGSQTDAKQNGLYTVVASGAAARATFADTAAELANIGFVIQGGTAGAGERWTLPLAAANITLGTTELAFAQTGVEPGYAAEVEAARQGAASLTANLTAMKVVDALSAQKGSATALRQIAYSGFDTTIPAASPGWAQLGNNAFFGYGQKCNRAGVSFNAIRIPRVRRRPDVPESQKWERIYVLVRTAASNQHLRTSPLVAAGWIEVDPQVAGYDNVVIPLREPSDIDRGALKTITNADLHANGYFVAAWAMRGDGVTRAAMSAPTGALSNKQADSYYYQTGQDGDPINGTGIWQDYSGDPAISLEHVLLTDPVDVYEPVAAYKAAILAASAQQIAAAGWAFRLVATWAGVTTELAAISLSQPFGNPVFSAWGAAFSRAGVSFNAISLPVVRTGVGAAKLRLQVRTAPAASQTGSARLVAIGETYLDPALSEHGRVTVVLRDPTTQAVVTLTDAHLEAEYCIFAQAVTEAGTPTHFYAPGGVLSNRLSNRSYYLTTASLGASAPFLVSTDVGFAFEHMLLTGVAEGYAPTAEFLASLTLDPDEGLVSELWAVPPVIYGAEGVEMNLYFDNVVPGRAADFFFDVTCTSGLHQDERWTFLPTSSPVDTTLTISIHDPAKPDLVKESKAIALKTVAKAPSAISRSVLLIGDSLTAAGTIGQTLLDLAAADPNVTLTLVGTKGTPPNRHEGNGGWTVARWYQPAGADIALNPFSDNGAVFSYGFGLATGLSGQPVPNDVLINLGINDAFNATSDGAVDAIIVTAMTRLNIMAASITADSAAAHVGICMPVPPAFSQDAFGDDYANGQTRWRFKRNVTRFARAIAETFKAREADRIFVVPVNVAFDSVHGTPYASPAPVNSRSSVQIARANNGVHPATSGYQQIADSIWAYLNWRWQQ